MIAKLLADQHLEFLSLKEAAKTRLSLHLSKYHTVGNHMSRLKLPQHLPGMIPKVTYIMYILVA